MPVDGLSSGLDTASIIKSLMALERAPQDAMVVRQKKAQSAVDAYASIRSKLDVLSSATAKLATAQKWNVMASSTSRDGVVKVTTVEGASSLALTLKVDQLASSHGQRSTDVIADLNTVVASSGSISIDNVSGSTPLAAGGGTLSEVVAAINNSDSGVVAAAVNTGSGFRLQLTSKATGSASAFSVTGLDGAGGTVVSSTGRDAQLTLGEGAGSYTITSATNLFTNVVPGVTIEAQSVSVDPISVTVTQDKAALADNVKGFVDALNGALSEVRRQSSYDPATRKSSPLTGDPAARRVIQELTSAISEAVSGGTLGSVGQVGIKLERNGSFSFDAAKFGTVLAADPDSVAGLFSDSGVAQRVAGVITGATSFTSGYLTNAADSRKTTVSNLETSIRDFDHRLEMREARMKKYWSALEVNLGNLQRQSSWLQGQVASLGSGKG